MIRKSQYKIDLPKDISLYLFIMAAIISVPPVLPLWVKTIPIPAPQSIPPMMHDINGSPVISGSFIYIPKNERSKVMTMTPNMVRMQNCIPKIRIAAISSKAFSVK